MRKISLLAIGICVLFGILSGNSFAQDTIQLPFIEQFSSGSFETNLWDAEAENWQVNVEDGKPAPAAKFSFAPAAYNYSYSLSSYWIDGTASENENIMISFHIKQQIVSPTVTEVIYIDVYDGYEWVQKSSYPCFTNTDWRKKTINITNEAKGKTFKIRFRAEGENSNNMLSWVIDNIEVWRECPAPINTFCEFANYSNDCLLRIKWEAPGTLPLIHNWLSWDNGNNFFAIGLEGGGTFMVAARFTQQQLYQYEGTSLTKIRFFPKLSGASFIIKVWTGANASELVRSQAIINYIADQWNDVELDEPLPIDPSKELWFGYEVTHLPGQYTAGCDMGMATSGYGDMISLDGVVWESMALSYGLNYNWNLSGYVTNAMQQTTALSRSPVNYNLYRKDILIATTTDLEYVDDFRNCPNPWYNVTAVYDECESSYSSEAWMQYDCTVSVNEIGTIKFDIYPNPASTYINVDYTGNINKIKLIDMMGRELTEFPTSPGSTSMKLDLTNFPEGIYLLRLEAADGSYGKKLVKQK